jgi:hypothetical protein
MNKNKKYVDTNKCNKNKFQDTYCYICDIVHIA